MTGRAAGRLVEEMTARLDRGEGYRFGESTVVSRRLHLTSPDRPDEVDIHTGSDAGRVFYQRRGEGQVLHLDVFHEVAEIGHREMARRLREAVGSYAARAGRSPGAGGTTFVSRRLADCVDIQTATGGGRITGSLNFGQGDTLRRSHRTHVHIALLLSTRDYALVPDLVMAVEDGVALTGHGIRRVERLNHVGPSETRGTVDLSEYASLSDSLLREPRRDWSTPLTASGVSNPSYLRAVFDLADELGGIEELSEVLESLDGRPTWSQLHRQLRHRVPLNHAVGSLEAEGLLECERGLYSLTPRGRLLRDYVTRHRRDIDLRFKLTLRRLPFSGRPGRRPAVPTTALRPCVRGGINYRRTTADLGGWVGSLAVPETVTRSLKRRLLVSPEEWPRPEVRREDIVVHPRRGMGRQDVCLVIDASASMAGPRMRAAKYLAQHLLLSTRDRVSVIVFQEREAGLYVSFTRNFEAVERGLRRIRPLGLTPLAEGIVRASEYIRLERARDPLLLLITDGIPTVPKWSMNPVADAQEAAGRLARERVRFSCVGLEPNRGFLHDLAAAGRGTLHIVEELEQALLSEIAHSERRRIRF